MTISDSHTWIYVLPDPNHFSIGGGGAVSHALGVANGLAELGYNVKLLAGEGVNDYRDRLTQAIDIRALKRCSSKEFMVRVLEEIARIAAEESPAMTTILIRKNLGTLIRASQISRLVRSLPNARLIYEINGLTFERLKGSPGDRLVMGLGDCFNKVRLHGADGLYVVNENLKSRLATGLFAIPESRMIMVPNGGPNPVSIDRTACGEDRAARFLFFGKLRKYNDFNLVFRAFQSVREADGTARLDICGFGECEDLVRRRVAEVAGSTFHGYKTFNQLVEEGIVTGSTIALLPLAPNSAAEFLSPIKLFDYMALGLPIIFSDLPNISGHISSGAHGWSYVVGDLESLTDAMRSAADAVRAGRLEEISLRVANDYRPHTWVERMRMLSIWSEKLGVSGRAGTITTSALD
jgi:glycosyltransferase involved in cell wall biosynthesis